MADTPDRSELRRLAEAAPREHWDPWSAASWDAVGNAVDPAGPDFYRLAPNVSLAFRDYMVAISPDVTLALLDALDSRDARIASLIDRIEALEPVYDDDGEAMPWAVFRSEVIAEARAALGSASGRDDDPRQGGSDDAPEARR